MSTGTEYDRRKKDKLFEIAGVENYLFEMGRPSDNDKYDHVDIDIMNEGHGACRLGYYNSIGLPFLS